MPVQIFQAVKTTQSIWVRHGKRDARDPYEQDAHAEVLTEYLKEHSGKDWSYEILANIWIPTEKGCEYRFAITPVRKTIEDCRVGECIAEHLIPKYFRKRESYQVVVMPPIKWGEVGEKVPESVPTKTLMFLPQLISGCGTMTKIWERIS